MSRKKDQKKPRSEYIYGTTKGEVTEIGLSIDPATGDIRFEQDMINVRHERSYEREGKAPKTVSSVPMSGVDLQFCSNEALRDHYDHVFAIDTGTKEINGISVSVSGIISTKKRTAQGEECLEYGVPCLFYFTDQAEKPENLAWVLLIQEIQASEKYKKARKIGIVVDSDLGNLKFYNDRSQPVYGNFYLPETMQLLYASADNKNDNIVCQMIDAADQSALLVRQEIEKGSIPLGRKEVTGPPYKGYTRIKPRSAYEF
ncbi:MAG: hypothetical protein H6855_02540 [Rhodospirillales bacterium]|nr:hypothetical protein [Rhodospirillales bacterium]